MGVIAQGPTQRVRIRHHLDFSVLPVGSTEMPYQNWRRVSGVVRSRPQSPYPSFSPEDSVSSEHRKLDVCDTIAHASTGV